MKTDYILTIAGNDILSGGGLQADLATFTQHGLFGFLAQTCLTSFSTSGFDIIPIEASLSSKQLKSLEDVPFSAIKLGLLPTVEIAEQVADFLSKRPSIPVVMDPVLVFKENADDAVTVMRDQLLNILPLTTVITPNLREAEILTGLTIRTVSDMKETAKLLHERGAKNVVVKGGTRLSKHKAIDLLYDGQEFVELASPLLSRNNNGAGCSFASSIASRLALGKTVEQAVGEAKIFVYHAIKHSNDYGVRQNYEKY